MKASPGFPVGSHPILLQTKSARFTGRFVYLILRGCRGRPSCGSIVELPLEPELVRVRIDILTVIARVGGQDPEMLSKAA